MYSFCISNANVIFKGMLLCESEQQALCMYVDYVWWMEFARQWMKGGN